MVKPITVKQFIISKKIYTTVDMSV